MFVLFVKGAGGEACLRDNQIGSEGGTFPLKIVAPIHNHWIVRKLASYPVSIAGAWEFSINDRSPIGVTAQFFPANPRHKPAENKSKYPSTRFFPDHDPTQEQLQEAPGNAGMHNLGHARCEPLRQ